MPPTGCSVVVKGGSTDDLTEILDGDPRQRPARGFIYLRRGSEQEIGFGLSTL